MDRRDFTRSMLRASARPVVIDSLCAPVSDLDSAPDAAALAAVRQSGITAVNFTVSVPDADETRRNIASVRTLVGDHPDLGFQFPTVLEQDPNGIATYRQAGVRIMQLTCNNRGASGDGCLEPANAGLTDAGRRAVKTMNDHGVAVAASARRARIGISTCPICWAPITWRSSPRSSRRAASPCR